MSRRTAWISMLAITLALATPVAAHAKRRTVLMGAPPSSQKALGDLSSDVNAFFPSKVTIHIGDEIAFTPTAFHSVDLPASGTKPLPLILPTGKKVAGVNDAAGMPFWFNGLPELGLNPKLLVSNFGKTLVQGATRITTGLPLGDKLKPMRVRFTRKGSFTYYCNVHPGQQATVRVVATAKPAQSAKAIAASVKAQISGALKEAKGLAATVKPPVNTIAVGAEGKYGVHHFGFLPDKLTVAVGTQVTFAMPAKTVEIHTVTAGPGNPEAEPSSYLGAIAKSFEDAAIDPRGTYPSEQPPEVAGLSPALHGNGFWNAGVLDTFPASPPPPSSAVTFGTAGTYRLYCLIHPFMNETVTVQ